MVKLNGSVGKQLEGGSEVEVEYNIEADTAEIADKELTKLLEKMKAGEGKESSE